MTVMFLEAQHGIRKSFFSGIGFLLALCGLGKQKVRTGT